MGLFRTLASKMALGDEVAVTNGSNDPKEEPKDPVEAFLEEPKPSETLTNTETTETSSDTTESINEAAEETDSSSSEKSEESPANSDESSTNTEDIPADSEETPADSEETPANSEEAVVESPEEEEDEPELIDPMDDIREDCKAGSEAVKMAQRLEECQNRVSSRSNTEETCHEEMIDYVHAVDHCMAKNVFGKLI